MLFPENDASLLRAWIIKRLANTSDADADVLADYVLALLRHDGDAASIRKVFEEEIPDFLREDAAAFTNDVFRAIEFRSYLPGALPAPLSTRPTLPPPPPLAPTNVPLASQYQPQLPYSGTTRAPPFVQSVSRKRAFNDRDDNDFDITMSGQGSYSGSHPYKQPRRGGNYSQRGGRFDDSYRTRGQRGHPNPYASTPSSNRFGDLPPPPPPFSHHRHDQGLPMDPSVILDGIQRLQQLGIPLPNIADLPKPVYSGSIPPPRRNKQRCRDFDAKGYCSRGNKCRFEHGAEPVLPLLGPPAGDEYDPNNAVFSMPLLANQPQPQGFPPLNLPPFPVAPNPNANRREINKPRWAKSPTNDKTKSSLVIQHIPDEHFSEEDIRGYFGQFGNILDLSMQESGRLAVVKFDTWDAANAAWSSPKVIFDNRFVKVYWCKDDGEAGSAQVNGKAGKAGKAAKNGATKGNALVDENGSEEPFDMDEFKRKQEEAQRIHDEKTKKRQELERQRQELEDRQKELRARQLEEKRKLHAKLTGKSTPSTTPQATDGDGKQPISQTEVLRAQLAALEEEANVLGIDPDVAQDDSSSWTARGRGRGGRGYHARGHYPPRAFRGSLAYRGRGGLEARHAAYAAYSLDNRPRTITLSGVDFTNPEKDEALRQYLFGIGEFKDIHSDPQMTHITFKDRKTAEQFMFGVSASNSIPGLDDKVEAAWATSAPQSEAKANAGVDVSMTSGVEDEHAARDKTSAGRSSATVELEEGEVENEQSREEHDMDYEAGEYWA
ncbi:hypothetical protein F4677DRAFT_427667 [Hypoxylon crocopeplum]|nr:hypothetical protein F4677DRAFT_427667 [Hypoxylon crocopeplum]